MERAQVALGARPQSTTPPLGSRGLRPVGSSQPQRAHSASRISDYWPPPWGRTAPVSKNSK